MPLQDKIKRIDDLQEAIKKHGKLPEEVLKKINYKFRLEWNYHSNSMEGNTLTRQETRTVMVGNITVEGKPIQDILEMRKHDDLITGIIKMGKGELNISEKRIKEIHSAIMYEENPEKIQQLGQWKRHPNHLINYKGERFDFVLPDEVPERMHQLVNWLNAEKEKIQRKDKNAIHPVFLAFKFHLDYVTIHPFYDGNGRTSRILTNIILISYGFPPMYVRTDERTTYYQYLADIQAYGGEPDLFYDFMAGLLIRSQEIVLNAIEGKNIDEPDDLDKRLFLLEKELKTNGSDNEITKTLSPFVFLSAYQSWLGDLLKKSIIVAQKFNKLFADSQHSISIERGPIIQFFNEDASEIIDKLAKSITHDQRQLNSYVINVLLQVSYNHFSMAGLNSFNCYASIEIKFEKIKFTVSIKQLNSPFSMVSIEKLLSHELTLEETNRVSTALGEDILDQIEINTKRLGLR